MKLFNFKKKLRGDLEEAENQGLITKEEMYRLKVQRAEADLKKHLDKKEPKPRKRK